MLVCHGLLRVTHLFSFAPQILALLMYYGGIYQDSFARGGGGGTPGILGGGVPPRSQSPDPISDPKMSFSTPVFRSDL